MPHYHSAHSVLRFRRAGGSNAPSDPYHHCFVSIFVLYKSDKNCLLQFQTSFINAIEQSFQF
jgi:hypothetical protein